MREIVNAIFYVLRGSIAWSLLSKGFLPWPTAYRWFARFRDDGSWEAINHRHRARRVAAVSAAGRVDGPKSQQRRQLASWRHDIGQCGAVEHRQKRGERIMQGRLQQADLSDCANVNAVEARDQSQVWLGSPDHRAKVDTPGGLLQPDPTAFPAHGLDVAGDSQLVHHLCQVILGDTVGLGDLTDRHQAAVAYSKVHQEA